MADNVTLNSGSGGATISTEDVGGGIQVQRIKVINGATDVDGGDVTVANPLPTQLTSGTTAVTTSNPLPVRITDGIDQVSITSGTMQAGFTDPALIVALAPTTVAPVGTNALLERVATALEALLELETHRGVESPVRIVDKSSAPAAIRQQFQVARVTDPSLVTQLSPLQLPVPTQSAPLGATPYNYYGYTPATANVTAFIGVPQNEVFANTTTPSIISASANDTIAGTGVRKVVIQYYDQAMNGPYFVTVNMNGVTAVNFGSSLRAPMCYIEEIAAIEFGTGFVAAGNIVLWGGAGATGTQIGQLNAGDEHTAWCRHYIPQGTTSYITGMTITLSAAGVVNAFIGATPNYNSGITGAINNGAETIVTGYIGGQSAVYTFPTPIAIPGPARFYMQGFPSISTGNMWGTMSFYDMPTGATPSTGNTIMPNNSVLPSPIPIK